MGISYVPIPVCFTFLLPAAHTPAKEFFFLYVEVKLDKKAIKVHCYLLNIQERVSQCTLGRIRLCQHGGDAFPAPGYFGGEGGKDSVMKKAFIYYEESVGMKPEGRSPRRSGGH